MRLMKLYFYNAQSQESYLPRPSSTDPQVYVDHENTIQGSYLPYPFLADPQVYVPGGGIGTRSFLTSTPSYNHHGNHHDNQEHCFRSAIPQYHFQSSSTRTPDRLQSQSCRPKLIQNFEFRPNTQNSFSSHQGWRDSLPHWSKISTRNCSVDLCPDSFCNNLPPQKNSYRNGFCISPPMRRSVPGMMHVVDEDRVISTSDEESTGDVSETYPVSVNVHVGSLTGKEMASVLEAKNIYSWIIKVLPDDSGPCVEGKLEEGDDTYWHSSLISERLESHLVQTVSGKVYRLMGDMEINDALTGGFDEQTVSEFIDGFPIHWRELIDQFFSRSHTKLSGNTISKKLSRNDVASDSSDEDIEEISLLDETVKPTKDQLNHENAQQNSEKRRKSKKVVGVKENLKPRNVGHLKKNKQGRGFQSPGSSGNVIEVCTPENKLIKLDSVQKTRSGRAVKPVVAWYAGQSISIDPKSNTYILKHRTEFAETFLKDMTTFHKTRSHMIRKTGMLNSSKISNTSRPHHKNKMSNGNQGNISHRKTSKSVTQSRKIVSKVLESSQTEREYVAPTISEQRPRKDRNVSDSSKAKSSPSAGERKVNKPRTSNENKKGIRRSYNENPGQPEVSRRNVPRSCNLRKRSERIESKKSESSICNSKESQSSNMISHKSRLGKQTEKENQEHAVWRKAEVTRFNMITRKLHQDDPEFWNKVVKYVKTKTLEDCQEYFYKEVQVKNPSKPAKSKDTEEQQIILTAKRGTLKRKQQIRNLVDHANKAYQEDLFDGTPYRHHSKMPRLSDGEQEDVFAELSRRNPHMKNKIFTPMTRINVAPVSTKKTPSSGLVGSDTKINRKEADHYMHKMKIHRRKLVNKSQSKTSKDGVKEKIPVPSKKLFGRSDDLQNLFMEGCGSDNNHDDSEEEIDYYFSGEEES